MTYFSRLTDIVTCNLSLILSRAENPEAALREIVFEMQEGIAGAERSVKAAAANVARIELEIGELRISINEWVQRAKQELGRGDEAAARLALMRKREVEDLIAGLEQQLTAAVTTREHLNTTLNALRARLADAERRLANPQSAGAAEPASPATEPAAYGRDRLREIEDELEAMKREIGD